LVIVNTGCYPCLCSPVACTCRYYWPLSLLSLVTVVDGLLSLLVPVFVIHQNGHSHYCWGFAVASRCCRTRVEKTQFYIFALVDAYVLLLRAYTREYNQDIVDHNLLRAIV